jgi:alpha-tubulin suppressor-like RCC1 family protein
MMTKKAPRVLLRVVLALLVSSCHLVIDLEKSELPDKDAASTTCVSAADCDDHKACTDDRCTIEGECDHFMRAAGTECRPSDGDCDAAEQCDGVNADCPPDSFRPATEVCRESADPNGTCDPVEYCTGDSTECPEDVVEPPGRACSDDDDCTYDDHCDGLGACVGTNGLSGVDYFSAAGKGSHTCSVLFSGREARCWGSGSSFQLGNGTSENSPSPVTVSGLPEDDGILQTVGGGYHTCALLRSGKIMCWGRNDFGQLGIGSLVESREPAEAAGTGVFPAWDFVAGGYNHTCAVDRYEGLFCWGANESGQIGDDTIERRTEPTLVAGLSSRALRVSAGYSHTCAVLDTGGIQCWGSNSEGQIGNDAVADYSTLPVDVTGLSADVVSVSLGSRHTCALISGGGVMCWGDNSRTQLGSETAAGGNTPQAVSLPAAASTASSISASTICAGEDHTCVLLEDGQVQCWGAGSSGQLGNGAGEEQSEPVSVTGLASGVTAVSCGAAYSCALFDTGTVYCWGSNDAGQLGNGTSDDSPVPVQVLCD